MGAANESAGEGLALRARRWMLPKPRWAAGFVELPRDAPNVRRPEAPEVWWAMGAACLVGLGGYAIAVLGVVRVNSAGLSAWLPAWWLAMAPLLTSSERSGTQPASPRVAAVRNGTVALMGALSGLAAYGMLTSGLFALGHHGDLPTMTVGGGLGCAAVFVAPFAALLALLGLRRGGAHSHRALLLLVYVSVIALGGLVIGASVRHLRAPDVVTWLNLRHETLRVPSFTRRPDLWERTPSDEHRHRLRGLVIEASTFARSNQCHARAGFESIPGRGYIDFPCDEGLTFGHDRTAQLLIVPRAPSSVAFDYGRRCVVGGVHEVRRTLAPVPEWTVGGALGLLLTLSALCRASRLPRALDRTAWRQGVRYVGEHEIVFDDGSPPLSASVLPSWCRGPVVVSAAGGGLGTAYRDDASDGARTVLAGSFDEVDGALRDARDVALTRALAIAWAAGAPLAGSWWAGLL